MRVPCGYIYERGYPYIFSAVMVTLCVGFKIDITQNADFKEVLNGFVTLGSIIIGFLGAILPTILSMKNESKFVRYVFEKDKNNLFAKYLKSTIFLGLFGVILSLTMHVRGSMPDIVGSRLYYFWMFVVISFVLSTYRSMSHMITLVFSKDSRLEESKDELITPERRQEIKDAFRGNE